MKAALNIISVRHELFFDNSIPMNADERYIVRMADGSVSRHEGTLESLSESVKTFINAHSRKLVCAGESYTAYEWSK